jgi:hypothetical protein
MRQVTGWLSDLQRAVASLERRRQSHASPSPTEVREDLHIYDVPDVHPSLLASLRLSTMADLVSSLPTQVRDALTTKFEGEWTTTATFEGVRTTLSNLQNKSAVDLDTLREDLEDLDFRRHTLDLLAEVLDGLVVASATLPPGDIR